MKILRKSFFIKHLSILLLCLIIILNNKTTSDLDKIEIFEDSSSICRLNNLIHAINIASSLGAESIPGKEIIKIFKKYFGINAENIFSKNFSDLKNINSSILKEMIDFNNFTTDETKYFFDKKIQYINSFSFNALKKLDTETLTKACAISFIICSFFPNEYIINENIYSKNFNLKNIVSNFKFIFNEIGISSDGYLYNDFEKIILEKLLLNEKFLNIKAGYSSTFDKLDSSLDDKNENIKNSFRTILNSFIKRAPNSNFNKLIDLNSNMFNWINSNTFNNSIKSIVDEDCLFALMIIGRLGLQNNINEIEIDNEMQKILIKYSTLSREILNSIFKLFKIKEINWKELSPILVKKDQATSIIEYISKYSHIGSIFKF